MNTPAIRARHAAPGALLVLLTFGCENLVLTDGARPDAAPDRGAVDDTPADELPPDPPPPPEPALRTSGKGDLVWKRHRAVESDLLRALELDKASLCNELDAYGCIDVVHTAPLGGNEPFVQGQLVPPTITTAATPLAFDRVVLAACVERAQRDQSGAPVVFTALDLSAQSLVGQDASVDATTDALFRRLLSRDPSDAERAAARALMVDDAGAPLPARDVAVLLCFAVGTAVEALFY